MYKIAIIGAGQLGTRHLQGSLKLPMACEIWVVDPSATSLETARLRATEVAGADIHTLHFGHDIADIPEAVDYAVVATTSTVRFAILQTLLHSHRVRNLILEKVLFQDPDHYARALELVEQHGVRTWVNCTRRTYPIYRKVKAFFEGEDIWSFTVSGGEWGLGCNAVHFLDLFAYVGRTHIERIDTAALDTKVIESRRGGFLEFTGTFRGASEGVSFEATAKAGSSASLLVQMRSEHRSCLLDESNGVAFFGDRNERTWVREEFTIPFLSDVSTGIVADILEKGESALPTLADSVSSHLPFVRALASFAARHANTPANICPIT